MPTPIRSSRLPDRLARWREARFGLFIHWGLYAAAAGFWKGQPVPGHGEWLQFNGRIPAEDYAQLARRFNPVRFNAEAWARLARQAGMRYLIFTAKHHDGFAMFESPADPYNIVRATPFGRDVVAELARACRRAGLLFGLYYSQSQDWHAPGGARTMSLRPPDDPAERAAFQAYLDRKVKPQLRELLTQYGPIDLLWFDTPAYMSRAQSLSLKRFVRQLQPQCLVSGRIGNQVGDYGSLGDNAFPLGRLEGDWETPSTINGTWGYKKQDRDWKPTATLLRLLANLASKGINNVLNVGPTGQGLIPLPSITRLRQIGRWMAVNGPAITGTSAGPFPYSLPWGAITRRGRRLYLLIHDWPAGPLRLNGLATRVVRAALLADPDRPLPVTQNRNPEARLDQLDIRLPRRPPDARLSTLVLHLAGPPKVDPAGVPQSDGRLLLIGPMATLHGAARRKPRFIPSHYDRGRYPDIAVNNQGAVCCWTSPTQWLSWTVKLDRPGRYAARLEVRTGSNGFGHTLALSLDGMERSAAMRDRPRKQGRLVEKTIAFRPFTVRRPGVFTLTLKTPAINPDAPHGVTFRTLTLVPLS